MNQELERRRTRKKILWWILLTVFWGSVAIERLDSLVHGATLATDRQVAASGTWRAH